MECPLPAFVFVLQFRHPAPVHVPPLLWGLPWPTQAFVSLHSTVLMPFLSIDFVLLWAMVCCVGAYLHHQIASFLKTMSSTWHLAGYQACVSAGVLNGRRECSSREWAPGRGITHMGRLPQGSLSIWKDVETDIITAAAKINTKICWTHYIRICV